MSDQFQLQSEEFHRNRQTQMHVQQSVIEVHLVRFIPYLISSYLQQDPFCSDYSVVE